MDDDKGPEYYCGSCGAIFGLDEIDDFDDVKCPECGSGDVGGMSDLA